MSMTSGASDLELTHLRKANLKRTLQKVHDSASSILLLTTQWKELDECFENTHSSIEQRSKDLLAIQETIKESFEELKEREKKLSAAQDLVKEREEKLGLVHGSVEERFREVELKEKEFELSQKLAVEEQYRRIEWIQESSKELTLVQESVESKLQELEVKEKEYVSIKGSIDERFKKLELREEIFEKLKERRFEQWSKDFELKEKQLVQELKDKEKKYEECFKELELKERQFELRSKEVELKDKKLEELSKELELKDERFEELFKKLELMEKQFEERSKEVQVKDKKLEERWKELGLKEKQVEERSKEVEVKEKRYANTLHTQVKTEPEVKIMANNVSAGANLRFCVDMDGKSLQIFLNERWKEHDSMRDEVLVVLQLSSNPAQLVLDAMQGFYPPHLNKEDVGFEESVIRSTCILLLEQLMKLSPEIKPNLRNEAMKVACDWITKMRVKARHSLEVLGFLQLLATYGLADSFDTDELLNYLEIVAQHSQAPELLRVLGSADKISGFIQNLIVKQRQVEAIKFIYAFKLVAQFPPVPLLKNYVKRSRKAANKLNKKGNKSLKAWNEARNKRVADLKAVIKCIEDHKLESEYPPGDLKKLVASLENQKANNLQTRLALVPKTPPKRCRGRKRPWTAELAKASPKVPTFAPVASSSPANPAPTKVITPLPTAAPSPATVPETKPQQKSGNKRPRIAESAKQPPHQQPALRTNQGVPYMNAPARHYNLGYPPMNLNTSSYHNDYIPYYSWDAFKRPGYY